jgi:xanthine dehydrogenase small subunit
MAVSFVLDGEPVRVEEVDPQTTLLQWLRATGRTGSKESCAEGECGSCAVGVLRRDAQGRPRWDPINGCLVLLPSMDGQRVVTVAGVASGETLHPVQRALVEAGGSQCGYCTPGFVVSLFCEYYRPGRQGYDPEAIAGNLCRCTGYRPIIDVARALPPPSADDPRLVELEAPPPLGAADHTAAGSRFVRPTSLAELWPHLTSSVRPPGGRSSVRPPGGLSGATLIAGGTDLVVQANQRYDRFCHLVALEAVRELRQFASEGDELVIGAGLTLSEIQERLAGVAMFDQLLPLFSSRLIRNRATLGGNLATASPIGDAAPALLALDASLTLASATGQRRLPLSSFFLGYRQTALGPGEVIVSVHLPRPLPAHQRFYKVSKRVLDDISTVAAAFTLDLADGRVQRLRVAYGGIAATPLRAPALEELARGQPWNAATLERLRAASAEVGTPLDDHRGSAAYRRAMVRRLLDRFFAETSA